MRTFLLAAAATSLFLCATIAESPALEIVLKTAAAEASPAPAPAAKKPAATRSLQSAKTVKKPKPQ